MGIRFDETNLRARMVGATHGLTDAEIAAAAPLASKALAGFRTLYESGEVGFPDLPKGSAGVDGILKLAAARKGTYDTVCLVGIGGSALGAWALDCGLRGPHPVQPAGVPRLVILDNVDPELVTLALASMKPKKTLVVVISKSGATAETVATILLDEFGAAWVRVKVAKPRKFGDVEAVGVQIERHARLDAARGPRPSAPVLHLIGGGMVPGDGVHVVFPMLMGLTRARYFLLTAQVLSAQQALDWGLVNEILPRDKLLPRAWELARSLAKKSDMLLRYTRAVLTHPLKKQIDEGLPYYLALEALSTLDRSAK